MPSAPDPLEPTPSAWSALSAFGVLSAKLTRIPTGLLNKTYLVEVTSDTKLVLQAVNAIFSPDVQEDIDAVTSHLANKGLLTPRLIRTVDGARFARIDQEVWRMLTYIDGHSVNALRSDGLAAEAGALLARFHAALADLRHTFKSQRVGVHDTDRHLLVLKTALTEKRDHRLYSQVARIAETLFEIAAETPRTSSARERVVHGDPKINNFIFDPETNQGRCLVDLDTVGPMPVALELADAFRSWCNPGGEDTEQVEFSIPLFSAAVEGYAQASRGFLSAEEARSLVSSTQLIITELSSRFAADALNEAYFGWDSSRFPARGEHNLLRATGQLRLVQSFLAQKERVQAAVLAAFGRQALGLQSGSAA